MRSTQGESFGNSPDSTPILGMWAGCASTARGAAMAPASEVSRKRRRSIIDVMRTVSRC